MPEAAPPIRAFVFSAFISGAANGCQLSQKEAIGVGRHLCLPIFASLPGKKANIFLCLIEPALKPLNSCRRFCDEAGRPRKPWRGGGVVPYVFSVSLKCHLLLLVVKIGDLVLDVNLILLPFS